MSSSSASSSDFNAEELLAFAISLSKEAGQLIKSGRADLASSISTDFSSILKKNSADLVTETDKATEDLVKTRIRQTYPDHQFIGEESWAAGEENRLGMEPTWICDPIDGTTNFVNAFPFCCISLALTYRQKLVLGVVYAPFLDRLYYGLSGSGSFLISPASAQPQRLPLQRPLPLPSLRQALIALEWGSDRRGEIVERKARTMERLCSESGNMVQGIRSIGSAALSCCLVAEGAISLYHEIGCWAWDIAAGWVMITEAGGLTVGSKSSTLHILDSTPSQLGIVTPEILQGRKYCSVRAVGDLPADEDGKGGKSGREQQADLLREFYGAMDEWEA